MSTIRTERASGASKLSLGVGGEVSVDEADMPLDELSADYEPVGAGEQSVSEGRADHASR
ncbi:hypothetical protein [Pandoraea sp. ISTKB]|uniref:hypothetical protein n=1 Tax=Pandoraea sp. ISTKB TaxID=1586708 RepID=UPI00084712E0|nr:hypothetical protein [Pandoraea sp. ISTKB]ODP35087.1 hypothetical protein A9762_12045 [Pandoraea sp. ISTKB]